MIREGGIEIKLEDIKSLIVGPDREGWLIDKTVKAALRVEANLIRDINGTPIVVLSVSR